MYFMKNLTIKTLFATAVFAFVLYSCTKDSTTLKTDVQEVEDIAHVITYSEGEPIEGSYIVIFKEEAFPSLLGRAAVNKENYIAQKTKLESDSKVMLKEKGFVGKELKQSFVKTIKGIAVDLNNEELETLRRDDRVAYIEQDQTLHVNMGGPPGGGGGGGSDPQVTPWGITRVGGATSGATGTAWIIDSGIDLDHEDLNVDVARSETFLGGNTTPDDQNGHGTHVAGTVAAIDNSVGVIGVAAGATVVSVRVLNRRGSGSTSGVIAGVDYVAANASSGDAANMSLGGGISTALDNAVLAASSACPFVLAAGNESQNANNSSPARVNGNNIYTVSSMAQGDNWSSFSNFGNPPVDYCAPGSSVYSTYKNGGYATLSGTSMAAPHVCGILLLGNVSTDGSVNGDPDGNPDPIAHK